MDKMRITLTVNGRFCTLDIPPFKPLSDVLREDLGLTGTKIGCKEGECGACSVIMNGHLVTSCLVPACNANSAEILTVEGLAVGSLSLIQEEFKEVSAVQCGFCTPGLLLAAYHFLILRRGDYTDDDEIKEAIGGNICRCTGYEQVVQAIKRAGERLDESFNP